MPAVLKPEFEGFGYERDTFSLPQDDAGAEEPGEDHRDGGVGVFLGDLVGGGEPSEDPGGEQDLGHGPGGYRGAAH